MQNAQSAIDRFIELLRLNTVLDHYCHLRGDFFLPHQDLPQGQAYFHLIIAGSCHIQIGKQHLALHSGDFLLLPSGEAHNIQSSHHSSPSIHRPNIHRHHASIPSKQNHASPLESSADLAMMCGYFFSQHSAAAQLMQQLSTPLHLSFQQRPEILSLYRLIQSEAQNPAAGSPSIIGKLCEILFIYALRQAQIQQLPHIGLFADPMIAKILPLISADFRQNYRIEQLAAYCHLSPSHFSRRFRQAAGISPQQFIRLLKMNHAADLLSNSQQSIQQIIHHCGYQSEAAFHHNFRKQFACTALQFRKTATLSAAEAEINI